MWAAQGEASWEGGGDWAAAGAAYDNNSIIYLADADDIGSMGCDHPAGGDATEDTDT